MTYQEAIDFLYHSLPIYQRQGKAAYKANLENTRKLDTYFKQPHLGFPSIHVAGTNGKGSVSHMLASVLQQAGYQVGLYTSPHLLDFRERIRINGAPIPESEITDFLTLHQKIIQKIHPSFFEMTVALAFEYFARKMVDIAIIETGLGGRLDSTNIITPVLSIITNISTDHTEFLGSDLVSIAREKGGIIKERIPLVIGKADEEIERVLQSMAEPKFAPVTLATRSFQPLFHTMDREGSTIIRIRNLKTADRQKTGDLSLKAPDLETLTCDLTGDYQQENVMTSLTAISLLRDLKWDISGQAVQKGFAAVMKNTGILGRWQTIGQNPRSVCDTAHNQAGISEVMKQLMQVPWKELHIVWGMVNDKNLDTILPLLPASAHYYFVRSSVPRSMDPEQIQKSARNHGLSGESFQSVDKAYRSAQQSAGPDDMIFTGGSTFVVADLLKASGY